MADAKIALSTGQEVRIDAQGRFSAKTSLFQSMTASVDEAAYQPWQGEPAFSFLPLAPAMLAASLQPTLLQGQVLNAVDSQPVGGATVTALSMLVARLRSFTRARSNDVPTIRTGWATWMRRGPTPARMASRVDQGRLLGRAVAQKASIRSP